MDTPDKLHALLVRAGLEPARVAYVPWSYQPDLIEFMELRSGFGLTSRRLAALDRATRTEVLRQVRLRLTDLPPEDFRDDSDVIAGIARRR